MNRHKSVWRMSVVFFVLLSGTAFPQGTSGKEVNCRIEIMPNYIWHLFALSNVWNKDRSPYGEEYRDTVPPADATCLFDNGKYIAWGNGNVAEFTQLLFFIPFREEISRQKYFEYLDRISVTLETGNWNAFMAENCPEYVGISDGMRFSRNETLALRNVVTVIKSNFETYETEVWPRVRKILEDKQREMEAYFKADDIIGKWEAASHRSR